MWAGSIRSSTNIQSRAKMTSPSSSSKSNLSLISILSNCHIQILTSKRLNNQRKKTPNLLITLNKPSKTNNNSSNMNTSYWTMTMYKLRDFNKETVLINSFPYKKTLESKSNSLIGLTEMSLQITWRNIRSY